MRPPILAVVGVAQLACATVPSGQAGVVLRPDGVDHNLLGEGLHFVGPLDVAEVYDLRAQEHLEDLEALSADGVPLEARASVVTYRPVPEEVVALARETGPDYYHVLIQPLLRSSLRKVLAGFRADQLDTPGIGRAEKLVRDDTARRLRAHHLQLESVALRTLRIVPDSQAYRAVLATGVKEQEALAARELPEIARGNAEALRAEARGIAAAAKLVAPTLSPDVLADARLRAWSQLLTSPSTHVEVRQKTQPIILEVEP
jgi:regulator of protease activity HflC (stomatin/prohibitin superfamily)